ncbi:MAG: type II secretion system major pseudopilin GspG [Deltaproteobacteria bacterium]|nr:type II secretion system major pseudopilin GspG [Deltaproteobacteria bacterium]
MRVRKHCGGFTLIELLVVLIILGLLAALVGPRLFGRVDTARQQAAQTQIEIFSGALDTYRLDNGKYPTTDQGLQALMEKPEDLSNWAGPYLKKEIPRDPWGNDYVYKSPGEHGDYDITSYGEDGQEGGDGNSTDIVSWKSKDQ